jgi:hypothetical protein
MTRLSKPEEDIRKGAWTAEEDEKLRVYVETNGTGHWRSVGKKAGRVTISRSVCVCLSLSSLFCFVSSRQFLSSESVAGFELIIVAGWVGNIYIAA